MRTSSGNTSIPSSWISDILYRRTPDGQTYLAVVLKPKRSRTSRTPPGFPRGSVKDPSEAPTALLYTGVPSYLPGLLQAGLGGRSIGRAYNLLLKGKGYPEQTVTGRREVAELKEMMK